MEGLGERLDLTIEELIERADDLLDRVAPSQTRYKVRERPDVRTIRYYVTQGLLPKPLSYEGGRARYGRTHLLRLLFIKKKQAEHETLARITAELKTKSDEELLALFFPEENAAPIQQEIELMPGARLSIASEILEVPALKRELAASLEALLSTLKERKR